MRTSTESSYGRNRRRLCARVSRGFRTPVPVISMNKINSCENNGFENELGAQKKKKKTDVNNKFMTLCKDAKYCSKFLKNTSHLCSSYKHTVIHNYIN